MAAARPESLRLDGFRAELGDLEYVHAVETVCANCEDEYHNGKGAVVQVLAVKPCRSLMCPAASDATTRP
jgi:hypothetical protein